MKSQALTPLNGAREHTSGSWKLKMESWKLRKESGWSRIESWKLKIESWFECQQSTVNGQRFFRVLETEKSVNISGICGKEKGTADFTDWHRRYLRGALNYELWTLNLELWTMSFELWALNFGSKALVQKPWLKNLIT